jgi:RNA polymerase sporulation-specific sigma factor
MSNALVSKMRAMRRVTSEILTDSPTEKFFANDIDYEEPGAKILEQENLKALYSVIRKNLSDLEYKIWQYYMSGKTASDIAKAVGKDEKSVTNAIYRIRKKLRALLH